MWPEHYRKHHKLSETKTARRWSHLMLYPMPDVLVGMRAGDAHGFGD
jgi:hypothetical protein